MRDDCAWSLLDPRPLVIYDSTWDAHLCFWNGVGMTRSSALLIYSQMWLNSYAALSARTAAYDEYKRLYLAGAFHTTDWDKTLYLTPAMLHSRLISLICKKDQNFFENLSSKWTAPQALQWFSNSRVKSSTRPHQLSAHRKYWSTQDQPNLLTF